ncbi:MAG: shikimate dehydrogenase [Acidimicrobiales bacterium]
MAPTGSTRVAAVIGSPIRHSLSPTLMNAAFDAVGLDWTFIALEVAEMQVPDAFAGVRTLGISGLSVTMPHKEAAAACADVLTPEAQQLGAVNCIVNTKGMLTGHNTDGEGFVRSLDHGFHFNPLNKRCVVFGAGGSARSIVLALANSGAAEIVVVNRTLGRAERAAALAGDRGEVVALEGSHSDLLDADLIVNATSVGMGEPGLNEVPFDASVLHEGQVLVDIVYQPLETPLLRAARTSGASAANGVAMLAHQAAVQFELWTGVDAPIDVMLASVATQLG